MNRPILILGILTIYCNCGLLAQTDATDWPEVEQKVVAWGHTIIKDSLLTNRQQAAKDLSELLSATLTQPGSFQYPFDSVKTISILYDADSTFRIFTWQLYVDVDQYDYFGFIQLNRPQPKVVSLRDRSDSKTMAELDLTYDQLDANHWYGALYYKIISFDTPEGKKHLLFGFDGYRFFEKRKLIDVLTFSQEGQPRFGSPVFAPTEPNRPDLTKSRIMLQFSAETTVSLNYNDRLGMIVFDHLYPYKGPYGNTYVPDGSYEGYILQNGQWFYVDKIFDQVSEKPPMPAPILDKRKGKNIVGEKH